MPKKKDFFLLRDAS